MTLLFVVIDTPTMEILLTALVASLWCLGVWTITEPGKLLSFLKQPILNYIEKHNKWYIKEKNTLLATYQEKSVLLTDEYKELARKRYNTTIKELDKINSSFKLKMKLLNPIILCPVCMGSVHGLGLFSLYQPMSFWVIPVMVMTAGLNKIWHEKIF